MVTPGVFVVMAVASLTATFGRLQTEGSPLGNAVVADPKPECHPPEPIAHRNVAVRVLQYHRTFHVHTCKAWIEQHAYECLRNEATGRIDPSSTGKRRKTPMRPAGLRCLDVHNSKTIKARGQTYDGLEANATTTRTMHRSPEDRGPLSCRSEGEHLTEAILYVTLHDGWVSAPKHGEGETISTPWGEECENQGPRCSNGTGAYWLSEAAPWMGMGDDGGERPALMLEGRANITNTSDGVYAWSEGDGTPRGTPWAYRLFPAPAIDSPADETYWTNRTGVVVVVSEDEDGRFVTPAPKERARPDRPHSPGAQRVASTFRTVAVMLAEKARGRHDQYALCLANDVGIGSQISNATETEAARKSQPDPTTQTMQAGASASAETDQIIPRINQISWGGQIIPVRIVKATWADQSDSAETDIDSSEEVEDDRSRAWWKWWDDCSC